MCLFAAQVLVITLQILKSTHINSAIRGLEWNGLSIGQNKDKTETDENDNRTETKQQQHRIACSVVRALNGNFFDVYSTND